jgi:hypothetical protein
MEQLAEEARKLEHAANVLSAEADLIRAHYGFNQARSDPAKTDEKNSSRPQPGWSPPSKH